MARPRTRVCATSYLLSGDHVAGPVMSSARMVDHWFMLSGVGVEPFPARGAVVVPGDSITYGRGPTTNRNDRWTDVLAPRLGGRLAR